MRWEPLRATTRKRKRTLTQYKALGSPLMTLHESDTVEFKESFDQEVVVTAGAFANTRGGTIFIGIDDR
jgi:hypothetical protein